VPSVRSELALVGVSDSNPAETALIIPLSPVHIYYSSGAI
jgi:hypothetical protein